MLIDRYKLNDILSKLRDICPGFRPATYNQYAYSNYDPSLTLEGLTTIDPIALHVDCFNYPELDLYVYDKQKREWKQNGLTYIIERFKEDQLYERIAEIYGVCEDFEISL